ncbi:ATP-binding protein [soil metagenome]
MAQPEDLADVRIHLPADVSSAAEARSFVADAVRRWGHEPPETLPLLTSEVVTNAVTHTDTPWVELRVRLAGGHARVEVHDADATHPVVAAPDPTTVGGFGMWLVAELARDWGVEEIADDGKVVWFEVALSAA